MTSPLVLVTGSNGYVGSLALLKTLQAGYRVRAAVRSISRSNFLTSVPAIAPYTSSLSFVEIPEFTAAVKDVDSILHIATPPPPRPSAANPTTDSKVKRAVLPSSAAMLIPMQVYIDSGDADNTYTAHSRFSDFTEPPYPSPKVAYRAGKIHATVWAEDLVKPQ
ncbi:Uu.00g027240.m01.CDS01 [Anthostomella pinea]|uniref:Uu.00g027240.m01.CDS01 n=1 Tax=Anthostomella pinea TaxID=933095 RepID=A0AAI8V8P9_9PEZI|nr:Uu.00g027240.m01.CDS01 [Anthostomella pinea]